MSERRIFTFWEPKGSMPAYLQLCRETWLRNSPGRSVVELNHDNLELYTWLNNAWQAPGNGLRGYGRMAGRVRT